MLQAKSHTALPQVAVAFAGAVQTVVHVPQWAGLFWRLKHVPEQRVVPDAHVLVQLPTEHTVLVGHTVPHAPQFLRSELRSSSQPSLARPLQSPNPGLQVEPHPPLRHVAIVCGRTVHGAQDVPQLSGLVSARQAPPQA